MRNVAGWTLALTGWLMVWIGALVGLWVLLGLTSYTTSAGPILNLVAIPLGVALVFIGRAIRGRGALWLALRRRARRKQGLDW